MTLNEAKEALASIILDLCGYDMWDCEYTTRGLKMLYESLDEDALNDILNEIKEKGYSSWLRKRFYYKIRSAFNFAGFTKVHSDENRVIYKNKITNECLEIRRIT